MSDQRERPEIESQTTFKGCGGLSDAIDVLGWPWSDDASEGDYQDD